MSELTRMVKIGEIEYSAQNEVADEIDALRGAEARAASAWNDAIEAAAGVSDRVDFEGRGKHSDEIRALRRAD